MVLVSRVNFENGLFLIEGLKIESLRSESDSGCVTVIVFLIKTFHIQNFEQRQNLMLKRTRDTTFKVNHHCLMVITQQSRYT